MMLLIELIKLMKTSPSPSNAYIIERDTKSRLKTSNNLILIKLNFKLHFGKNEMQNPFRTMLYRNTTADRHWQ